MKACQLYKKKKEYKIVTAYQVDVGRYCLDAPIFILPISDSIDELQSSIFQALNASKKITYDEYYAGISPKELLKEMKESSFSKLYNDSTSCMVYLKGDIIEIVPFRSEPPKKGLYPVNAERKTLTYSVENELVIVDEILKVLSKQYYR